MTYQRNPLASQLSKAEQAAAKALEQNQRLKALLSDARKELRTLRADKIRLQARIADLKRYRPQAPVEAAPHDEAEARRRAADAEVAAFHRKRRTNHQGYGRKKVA